MLRACVLTDDPKWDKHLPLAEFSYNNCYQESIKISPFEALYGWPCRTPLSWSESGERIIFGPDIVTEAEEKVKQIWANILAAQSSEKSYTDMRHSPMEFKVGDHIYLRVSLMKGVRRFGIKGKLDPRYIGLYPIIDKYGSTSYYVELPSRLSGVHNIFHVSQLKRCMKPPTDVVVEPMLLSKTPSHWNWIWHTRRIPPRFSTNKTEFRATRLLDSTRSNGMITLKMKPCGNMKNSCDPTTSSFFHRGNCPNLVRFHASCLHFNLGVRFLFKGGM
jgi:hypothetical protein